MKTIFKSTDKIPPGRYLRTWGAYSVQVEIFASRADGGLTERVIRTGVCCEPRDNMGATYEPLEVAR